MFFSVLIHQSEIGRFHTVRCIRKTALCLAGSRAFAILSVIPALSRALIRILSVISRTLRLGLRRRLSAVRSTVPAAGRRLGLGHGLAAHAKA